MKDYERFEKAMKDLYGEDIDNAVQYCINETFATYGDDVTLDQLFVVWGNICETAMQYA